MAQYYFFMNIQFPFIAKCVVNTLLAWKTSLEKLFLERQTKAVYRSMSAMSVLPTSPSPPFTASAHGLDRLAFVLSRKYPLHLLGSIAPQPIDESNFRGSEASHDLEPLDQNRRIPLGPYAQPIQQIGGC